MHLLEREQRQLQQKKKQSQSQEEMCETYVKQTDMPSTKISSEM